jgi:hypothetical protein
MAQHPPPPPSGPRPPHYRGFAITLRHTTLGRTHLDEWLARRRDIYLTPYNTHYIQAPGGIRTRNPSKRTAADHAIDRAATGIGKGILYLIKIYTEKLYQQKIPQYASR